MSKLALRGWLKAVAADSCQLLNSPSTRKDNVSSFPMKPALHFIPLAIACISSFGFAEDEQLPLSEATTARIIGDLPDGTPSPPEPPKPAYIVPAKDILGTEIHEQGGQKNHRPRDQSHRPSAAADGRASFGQNRSRRPSPHRNFPRKIPEERDPPHRCQRLSHTKFTAAQIFFCKIA